ncbi:hypothetical protein BJP37_03715 [Moorena bouillonii PNG]|uniref:Uncharacterized protein n=1 Tax=Moorena bouillonii PNG TaxID=568701 RepID=A0A1U7MX93_9CYAN|nr:hypothetical protein BJP37_03715 [Moorena bouillonii PNG]
MVATRNGCSVKDSNSSPLQAQVFLESESQYLKKSRLNDILSERVEAIGTAKWAINPMLVVVTSNAPKGYLL